MLRDNTYVTQKNRKLFDKIKLNTKNYCKEGFPINISIIEEIKFR